MRSPSQSPKNSSSLSYCPCLANMATQRRYGKFPSPPGNTHLTSVLYKINYSYVLHVKSRFGTIDLPLVSWPVVDDLDF